MFPIIYSDQFLLHDPGEFHPESPDRLTAIKLALEAVPWADQLTWRLPSGDSARSSSDLISLVQAVHAQAYIDHVRDLANRGGGELDSDTVVSPQTYEVALLAVSAWLDGVDAALATGEPVFVLARPPGHHALPERGMGFCIFNNEAIAALYALQQPGVNRVAILDWDVHHGNGTQVIVRNHPHIAYCSLHESPLFPDTGNVHNHGPHHNVLNLAILPGSTIAVYQPLFEQQVIPFLTHFQPDLLLVSAGYDATAADPLADICLQPQDYGVFTKYCLQITRRIVFGLEGGYNLDSLARSVVATIESCLK